MAIYIRKILSRLPISGISPLYLQDRKLEYLQWKKLQVKSYYSGKIVNAKITALPGEHMHSVTFTSLWPLGGNGEKVHAIAKIPLVQLRSEFIQEVQGNLRVCSSQLEIFKGQYCLHNRLDN